MRNGSEECFAAVKLPRVFRSFATVTECTACGRCQDVLQPPSPTAKCIGMLSMMK